MSRAHGGASGCRASLLLIGLICCNPSAARLAARETESTQHGWALLIGVEDYQLAPKLQYTVNDVRQLAATLEQHGGYEATRILQITDQEEREELRPMQAHLLQQLPGFLAQPGPKDTIIVYFSGHGFRDASGRLYLAPQDCDPAAPTATGVPVEWFRDQLLACKAGFKLLILDACHAGSEKGDEPAAIVTAKDLGDEFKQAAGVITLASSTAEEKSQIWQFKQQSLFSYWLNQGLRGHSDVDGDGQVTVDELYQYVYSHVSQTSKVRFQRAQTPVRIVGPRTPGVPVVLRLLPQSLKQVLTDMSEQLSGALEEQRLKKVGVLEFTNDTKVGELLGANFGLLGRYCSEELERRLTDRAAGNYAVVERGRLQAALKEQGFGVKDLASDSALRTLAQRAGGMPAVVRGTMFDRAGRMINLRCKLMETEGDATVATVGGLAQLSESEWGMLGRSVALTPEDRQPEAPGPGIEPMPVEDQVVERADERSRGTHPLQEPEFPFPIRCFIAGKERPFVFRQVGEGDEQRSECFLPVRVGEVMEVRVENRTGKTALLRLLVDGLNTLPEKDATKGVATYVWGQRVNLEDARYWVLDPAAIKGQRKLWAIRGFVTETGVEGKLREFVVVEAEKSLAARQQFTEKLGIITAAFHAPAPSRIEGTRGPIGIGAGAERREDLREKTVPIGDLLAVVHIRYVEAESLKTAAQP